MYKSISTVTSLMKEVAIHSYIVRIVLIIVYIINYTQLSDATESQF